MVKHLPTMWETQVQPLGQEDLLEKQMATHSSILAWRIPWTEEPGGLQSMGSQRVDRTERLHFHFLICSLQLNFLFWPLILHELHFTPTVLWFYANFILYLMLTTLCKPTLIVFLFLHIWKKASMTIQRRQWTQLLGHQTARGYLTPVYDYFETTQEEEDNILTPLILITDPLIPNPHLVWAPRLLMVGWAQFLRHEPSVPPPPAES